MESSESVFVFIDTSNLWIEGKCVLGTHYGIGLLRNNEERELNTLTVDYGLLLQQVQGKRRLKNDLVVVGSRPPKNDSLWRRIEAQGFGAHVFDRSAMDVELSLLIRDAIEDNPPATIVFVGGNANMDPVFRRAVQRQWKVEVWFWRESIAGELVEAYDFHALNPVHTRFCFCRAEFPHKILFSDGDYIRRAKDDDVLALCNCEDCLVSIIWEENGRECLVSFLDRDIRDKIYQQVLSRLPSGWKACVE